MYLGELNACREHLNQVLALYDLQQHCELSRQFGGCDPKAGCLVRAAGVFWYLGYPDQAAEMSWEALELAGELAQPYTLAVVLCWTAYFHQYRQEVEAAREWADATVALCSERKIAVWLPNGRAIQGWALVRRGQRDEGIAQLSRSLAGLRAPHRVEISYLGELRLLADAYRVAGRTSEGLAIADEALALVDKIGCIIDEPELYRLKGDLLLQRNGNAAEAEACFHKAIESAQREQAKSWELRAAMSLARLWEQHGKIEAARHLLAEVYGWFTEGFDTPDLQEAKALLEELA